MGDNFKVESPAGRISLLGLCMSFPLSGFCRWDPTDQRFAVHRTDCQRMLHEPVEEQTP